VTVRVPAKVNLLLQVAPPRPDGFHDLVTVFHAVSLYDEVVAERSAGLSLSVEATDAEAADATGVPADPTNLAWRAAAALADACGVSPDVHLRLRKAIPVAGGMAGGSADAAAALVACAALWGVRADLAAVAARLGSDVAFPLLGGTAVGTGRGEQLRPVPCAPLHWVFVPAAFGIGAGEAYRELDRLRAAGTVRERAHDVDALLAALAEGEPDRIGALLGNDLKPAAISLAPTLADTLAAGTEAGAVAGLVSGSGPTCAFLCRSADHATDVARRLAPRRVVVAAGPVPGATAVG
jgi:4-diphosphocytidyl-2-C-methyl-D-erythritol kinase